MKTELFDREFDAGKDVTSTLVLEKACRPNLQVRRVNVDFPEWMIKELDREAKRLGVTRQSVIKVWLSQRIDGSFVTGAHPRTAATG